MNGIPLSVSLLELNFEYNVYPNLGIPLSDQQKFRLNKIDEIKDYLAAKIKERELMSKRLSKYLFLLTSLTSH